MLRQNTFQHVLISSLFVLLPKNFSWLLSPGYHFLKTKRESVGKKSYIYIYIYIYILFPHQIRWVWVGVCCSLLAGSRVTWFIRPQLSLISPHVDSKMFLNWELALVKFVLDECIYIYIYIYIYIHTIYELLQGK